MVILVDTNVVIDFLTTREPFYTASSAVMTKCAESIGADYIITRNEKDFEESVVPAVSPERFIEMISD